MLEAESYGMNIKLWRQYVQGQAITKTPAQNALESIVQTLQTIGTKQWAKVESIDTLALVVFCREKYDFEWGPNESTFFPVKIKSKRDGSIVWHSAESRLPITCNRNGRARWIPGGIICPKHVKVNGNLEEHFLFTCSITGFQKKMKLGPGCYFMSFGYWTLHSLKGHLLKCLQLPEHMLDFCLGDPNSARLTDVHKFFDNNFEAFNDYVVDYQRAFPQRKSPNSLITWKYDVPTGYVFPDHLTHRAKTALEAVPSMRGRPITMSLLPNADPMSHGKCEILSAIECNDYSPGGMIIFDTDVAFNDDNLAIDLNHRIRGTQVIK